ncbi:MULTISPECIES: hypothetical protein [Pseudomonas fluorescens group]
MKKRPQEIQPPYWLFVLAATPIFFINFLLPSYPITPTELAIAAFIDNHLFGQVGFWSSRFPFSSKVTANYLACIGPVFAILAFYKTYQTMRIDPKQYENYSLLKYALIPPLAVLYILLFLFMFYLTSTNLASNSQKYSFYGSYALSFSLFSSSMLIIFYITPLIVHRCFIYLPALLLENWRDKRSQSRPPK